MTFETALPLILAHEGGYSDRPADRGGPTKQGVTQAVYDAYRARSGAAVRSVRDIEGSEVADIYKTQYWQPAGCDPLPEKLALCVFDSAVNHGVRKAKVLLQRALGVNDDGVIGPSTLSALNDALIRGGEDVLVSRYLEVRGDFYDAIVANDPSQAQFIKGWHNRIIELRKETGVA